MNFDAVNQQVALVESPDRSDAGNDQFIANYDVRSCTSETTTPSTEVGDDREIGHTDKPATDHPEILTTLADVPAESDQFINFGPYEIRASGIWHTTQNPTQSPDQRLSDRLVMVAWVRSKAGDEWSKLLEFTDRDGVTKQWAMPMSMLATRRTEIFSTLMGQGWGKEIGNQVDSLLYDFLNKIDSPRRYTSTRSIGWHEDGFLLPDAWFGPKDEEYLLVGADEGTHAFQTAGTLATWQSSVAAFCVGNSWPSRWPSRRPWCIFSARIPVGSIWWVPVRPARPRPCGLLARSGAGGRRTAT